MYDGVLFDTRKERLLTDLKCVRLFYLRYVSIICDKTADWFIKIV